MPNEIFLNYTGKVDFGASFVFSVTNSTASSSSKSVPGCVAMSINSNNSVNLKRFLPQWLTARVSEAKANSQMTSRLSNPSGERNTEPHQGIRCLKCKTAIFSMSRHDFKYCPCGAVFVDGGKNYLRIGGDRKDFEIIHLIELPTMKD